MKIKKISLIIVVPLILNGCSVNKKLERLEARHPEMFQLHNSDSVRTVIKQTEHDSTIILPGQTITQHDTVPLNVPCPEHYYKVSRSNGITATVAIDSGHITVTCHEDSLKQLVRTIRDSVKTFEVKNTSGMATITNTVYKSHWYDIFCRCWFALTFGCIVCWVGVLYMRGKLKV